jgi:hypothetical protein
MISSVSLSRGTIPNASERTYKITLPFRRKLGQKRYKDDAYETHKSFELS